ncbi:MAG: tetratricopeptide repeat protein [Myxococcota bacterium]
MAINKRKVLEAARKHAQKGAQAKALKEFEKLLKLDPRDARLRLEIGDAHRRWGNIDKAIETYGKVADEYMKEGFDARAVAVYKQIHNLNPEAFETYEPLAELYQRMGLPVEAIQALQTAADGYNKQGKKREALDLLRRMATLDPSNTTSRIKVADLLRQGGLESEAVAEYTEAAAEFERQGDHEGVANALERILEIYPERIETLTALAENLLGRGLADRAEPLAKRAVGEASQEPERYELLASVYRAQQRDDELVDTYRQLSDLYLQRGDDEQARDILQRYVPSSNFDDELGIDETTAFGAMGTEVDLGESGTFKDAGSSGTALGGDPGASGTRDEAEETRFDPMVLEAESPSKLEDDLLFDEAEATACLTLEDVEGEEDEEISLELDDPIETSESLPREEASAPPLPTPTGDPEQLLAEASVYLRYGKRERAVANLEAIIAQEPAHREAHEKLGEAHADAGDVAHAVEMWLKAASLSRDAGDSQGVAVLRDRIRAIDPEAAESLAGDAPAEADAPASDDATDEDGHEIDLDDIEIDLDDSDFADAQPSADGDDDNLDLEVSDSEPESAADSGGNDPGASSSMVQQINEDLEEADFYMKQGLHDEAEVIFQRVLSIAPNHPHALVRLGEVAALRGEEPGATGTASAASGETPPELGVGDEIAEDADFDSWIDDIPAPDEIEAVAPEMPETEIEFDEPELDLVDPGGAADQGAPDVAEPAALDAAGQTDTELEDDLAEQFLAEVTVSEGASADDDTGVDDEAGDTGVEEAMASEDEFAIETRDGSEAGPPTDEADSAESLAAPENIAAAASEADAVEAPGDSLTPPEPIVADPDAAPDLEIPRRAAAPIESGFDLAAELEDALDEGENSGTLSGLGDSADGFAVVFNEFKQGVSRTLSEADHEAHFDLGIAYREMGLFDDAKEEFRTAMQSSEREVECRHMLGLCCFEQEHFEEAVAEFEHIVSGDAANPEQKQTAQLELGRSWEALREPGRAREAYEAVAAVDPTFCEVDARLAALDEPEKPEAEGEFESFEDLIAEESDDEDDAPDDAVVAEPAAEYESFDDIVGEAEHGDDWLPAAESAETAAQPEPEEGESAIEAPPEKKKKRRKKISFV